MASEIFGVLLVPAEGDPLGLLAEGPCGARPPTVGLRTRDEVRHQSNEWADPTVPCEICTACGQVWPCDTPGVVARPAERHWIAAYVGHHRALVLAWDRAVVKEGVDRLHRATREGVDDEGVRYLLDPLPHDPEYPTEVRGGTLVWVDAAGQEMVP